MVDATLYLLYLFYFYTSTIGLGRQPFGGSAVLGRGPFIHAATSQDGNLLVFMGRIG